MSWIRGSSSGYKALSDAVVAAVTATSADSVDSVAAGGSGYVVGDLITLTGGTFTTATVLEVTSVSTGAVTGARIYNAGIYSAAPGDPVAQGSTTGGGTGATFNMTYSANGWTEERNHGTQLSAVDGIAAGGSGYAVNDLITIAGGEFTVAAVIQVDGVSGGAVTAASVSVAGNYEAIPGDPVAQATTDGGGTGATFNLTFGAGDKRVVLSGSGGGSDNILVGWRSYENSGAGRYNWELHGMTGHDADVGILSQVGVSPGDYANGVTALQYGTYLPLINAPTTIEWFLSVTPYRIKLTCKVASNYFHAYLGFLNRYATTTEYPYPLAVCGSTNWADAVHNQSERMSTLTDPWTHVGLTNQSPVMVLKPDGSWLPFANSTINGGTRNSASIVGAVMPCGAHTIVSSSTNPPEDDFLAVSADLSFAEFIQQSTLTAPDANLESTPGSGNDEYVLFPALLVYSEATALNTFIPGELDDVYWLYGFNSVVSEDRIVKDGEVYRVFQNCNRTGAWELLAVKEN